MGRHRIHYDVTVMELTFWDVVIWVRMGSPSTETLETHFRDILFRIQKLIKGMCLCIKDGKYFHLEHKELISTFDNHNLIRPVFDRVSRVIR